MHDTWLMLVTYFTATRAQLKQALADETGLSTLEVIILALGLFTAAGAAVAVIANAIGNRTAQIN